MTDPLGRYRQESGVHLIEIQLNSLAQMFNSMDPSPFHDKDLDADAEEYIVSSARELRLADAIKLVLYLPRDHSAQPAGSDIERAIHNYFAYREDAAWRELRFNLRQGRTALLVGLCFLAACLAARQLISAFVHVPPAELIAESLLIIGWVAMWRPLEIFLYEWWPIRNRARLYGKLASMPVEVRPWP
ncbi:MAG: hypothetical protein FJX35_12780 [Alphaproteobacteria bacterium]|nr:hypothetical protein [Alphaproteobacteria bacterium]